MRFKENFLPFFGMIFIIIWAYLTFFSYPSVLWVKNTDVFEKNWDTYIDFSVSPENASRYDVVALPAGDENIGRLLGEGKNLLIIGRSEKYEEGCHEYSKSRICVVVDGEYKYPIYYLSGRDFLFSLNNIAFVFLVIGIVFLKDIFLNRKFHVIIIFLFALLGMRKYIIGLPLAYDLHFYIVSLWLGSQNTPFTNHFASGMPVGHYYPPLYQTLFSIPVPLIGVLNAVKLSVFFILFLSGLSAYIFIPKMLKEYRYGVISALLYMLSPFMLFDLNTRGGIQEAFTLVFVPPLFYFLKRILEKGNRKYEAGFVVCYVLILLNHIPSTIIVSFAVLVVTLFNRDIRNVLNVFFCVAISFLLSSFWFFPFLTELGYTYHETYQKLLFDFFSVLTPKTLECSGLCPINTAFYVSLVMFILTLSGMAISIQERETRRYFLPFAVIFLFLFMLFVDPFFTAHNLIPLFTDVVQWTVRFFVVLSFVMVLFSSVAIKKIASLKKGQHISKFLPFLLLALFILDVYPLTGASFHSKNPDYVLFSFDAFKRHSDYVIPPEEYKLAIASTDNKGKLLVGHEGYVSGMKVIYRNMLESSAAVFFGREVLSPFPFENVHTNYKYANNFIFPGLYIWDISKFLGYMGVRYLILESDPGYESLKLIMKTDHLYVFENPYAQDRVGVYRDAVFLRDGPAAPRDQRDFLTESALKRKEMFSVPSLNMNTILFLSEPSKFAETRTLEEQKNLANFVTVKPDVDVEVREWGDTHISLNVNSDEEGGFVLVRVNAQPDWVLRIDGKEEKILKADPYYIAFHVGRGEHEVELVYSYLNWRHITGWILTLFGFLILLFKLQLQKKILFIKNINFL